MVRQVANRKFIAKVSKDAAEYEPGPERRKPCQDCTMFREPNRCTEVAGPISPTGTCKFFERTGRSRRERERQSDPAY